MLEQQENIEDIINYFAISLFGQGTIDGILWDLVKNCISKLSLEDCVIYLVDEQRNVLVQKAAYGPKNPKDYTIYDPIEIPVGKGIVGSVAQFGKAEIISDTSTDPRYITDDAFRYSEIAVPIILDGNVIGVIDCEHSERDFFNARHLKILTLIAALCANKLMWVRAEEKVKKEQLALYEAQQKLSEFKLYALQSQMNPHFVFNALNAVQHFITIKDTNQALKYLSLFAKFIRKILRASSQIHIPLAEEVEILTSYLDLEKLRFEGRFSYKINIGDGADPHMHNIPVLLIQPFVERTLTNNLLHSENSGILNIEFQREEEFIICTIMANNSNKDKDEKQLEDELTKEIHNRIGLLNRVYTTNILVNVGKYHVEIKIPVRMTSDL